MLNREQADDFVIASGESHSLEDFVGAAFSVFDLDWKKYVDISRDLFRPTDINFSLGDPAKARERLNWEAQSRLSEVVRQMALSG